ncbi:MAG: TetR/AcrR family transcriptional regulator [Thermodesulfobacteriota bacterium]
MGRKSNAAQRREEIVWALYNCLAEGGHEKVTVKDIAARAKLPHGVIHYYFEKKDDIVAALVESLIRTYLAWLGELLESAPTPESRLDQLLELLVNAFVFDRRLNRVFYNLVQMGFERRGVQAPLRRMLEAYRNTIEGVLREAGAGERSGPLACLLTALIEGLALQWMIDPDALPNDRLLEMVRQSILTQMAN